MLDDVDPWYWAYFGGFFVMVIVGMLVQCGHYRAEKARLRAARHPYMVATQDEVLVCTETAGNAIV